MLYSKSLIKIKKRILNIIDSQFQILQQKYIKFVYQNQNINLQRINIKNINNIIGDYAINEAKLEDWIINLNNQIIQWQSNTMKKVHKKIHKNIPQNQQNQIQHKIILPSVFQQKNHPERLFKTQKDKLTIFTLKYNNAQSITQQKQNIFKSQTISFSPNTLKQNSSLTFVSDLNSIFMIGGSLPNNPNLKSNQILQFSLQNQQLQQFNSIYQCLPYGLSSHGTVYNQKNKQIYIIGGNRDHSVVSRGCFKIQITFNLDQQLNSKLSITQIACLNYPAASLNCTIYKNKFIYKIGGIGQSFGEWGNSPYLQRYSIQLNQWQVINPQINPRISLNQISKYIFMANSLCYISENQQNLVIFGGYKIDGKGTNCGIIIKLDHQQIQQSAYQDNNNEQENFKQQNQQHQIIQFGQVENFNQKAGFNNNQVFSFRDSNTLKSMIFSLATIQNNQNIWTQQPIFFQL